MNHSHKIAIRIAIIYIILGVSWIIVTDFLSLDYSNDNFQRFAAFQKSKGWVYIFLSGFLVYGIVLYWIKKLLDSQKELQVSHEKYQSLFMQNPDAVLELNLEGKMVSFNPQAEHLFGNKLEFLKEKHVDILFHLFEVKKFTPYFNQVLNKVAVEFETTIRVSAEEVKIVRCSLFPIIVQGEINGVYVVMRDITKIRREEELVIMSEKASVVGHLAAAVAHEIRNPLTSIKGFIQLIQMTKELDERYLEIILQEIDRINIITSEMLILGKNQAVIYHEIDLRQSVGQVFTLMKAQANIDNIELTYEEADQPVIILANDTQMKQVLINLIKNSIEAVTKRGKISIDLRIEGKEAALTVTDNGIGIEQERLERIGELFYSTKEKGTGIGLAVCHKIIHRHHGKITFESEKNKGTTVTIRIPLAHQQVVL